MFKEFNIDLIKGKDNYTILIPNYRIELLPSVDADEAVKLFLNLGKSLREILKKSSSTYFYKIEK